MTNIREVIRSDALKVEEKVLAFQDWKEEHGYTDLEYRSKLQGEIYNCKIELYCKECLKIRNKSGYIVPLEANEHQKQIIDIVEQWKDQYPDELKRPTLYIMILKARQIGFSTIVEAVFFHELNFKDNKIAMVVSYDDDSAKNINDMSDRYYQYLPPVIKPVRRPSRGKGILFENPDFDDRAAHLLDPKDPKRDPGMQSKFLIDTARNKNAGSSFTLNYLHISELAKWADAKATLTSLLQAVPQYGGIVVIESTANGIEHFHKLWQDAKSGGLNYKTIFVPWFEHSEYSLAFETERKKEIFQTALREDEVRLQKLHSLTPEQLNWRRDTIRKKCQNDKNIFDQEYPHNDVVCFLTSGRPVFDRQAIEERKQELLCLYKDKPFEVGYIEYNKNSGKYEFMPDEFGPVKIYERPKPGYPYVMGGDIAEGLSHGDWSVAPVCDNTSGVMVAKLRLHIHPDLFANEQLKLAHFYNDALIADEVNNHGLTTITALQNAGYYNQYRREVIDKISKTKLQKFGFDTKGGANGGSRRRAINNFRAISRDNIEWITDIETLDEMLTFIYNSEGKEIGESDCHDDCVLSAAIMYEARSQFRMTPPRADTSIKPHGLEMVHPSVYEDMQKNPSLRAHYKNMYEIEVARRHGLNIVHRRRGE